MAVVVLVVLAYFWTNVGGQLSKSPAVADVTTFIAPNDLRRTQSEFISPKICFTGSSRPGVCVARSRCRSSDIVGSGVCRSGQICCQPQNVGTGATPAASPQQLVADCGRATPQALSFEPQTPGPFPAPQLDGASLLRSDGSSAHGLSRVQRDSKSHSFESHEEQARPAIIQDFVPVERVGRWPWMALLGHNEPDRRQWRCGGALLSRDVVLTAAHCVSRLRDRPEELTVRLGEYDISTESDGPGRHTDVGVARVVVHPDYDASQNDLALLRLDRNVTFSARVRAVCLPPPDSEHTGRSADLAGWGPIGFGERTSDILQQVNVQVVDEKSCEARYKVLMGSFFTSNFPAGFQGTKVCVSGQNETSREQCHGDAAAPIVVQDDKKRYQLIGVRSRSVGCGQFPGIYTKVSKYLPWIMSNRE